VFDTPGGGEVVVRPPTTPALPLRAENRQRGTLGADDLEL
jgi:hypothetical protein